MTYYLRIFLTDEQNRILRELRTNTQLPQRVRDRAEAARLNAHGWKVEKIATYLQLVACDRCKADQGHMGIKEVTSNTQRSQTYRPKLADPKRLKPEPGM